MSKLHNKIQNWAKEGIISQEQAQRMLQSEQDTKSNWMLTGFYILAASIIATGVISVVAFNWEHISNLTKLILDFIVLIAVGAAGYYFYDKNSLKYEMFVFVYMFLTLASLALIGQIYNLHSPIYISCFLLAGINLVIVAFSQRMFNWVVWLYIFLSGIQWIFLEKWDLDSAYSDLVINTTIWLGLVAAVLYTKKYLDNNGLLNALSFWMLANLVVLVAFLDFGYHDKIVISSFGLIAPLIALLVCFDAIYRSNFLNSAQKILIIGFITLVLIACCASLGGIRYELLSAVQTVILLLLCAIICASMHRKYLFNLFIGLTLIRSIAFYFQAFGGLATTGVSLIILGVIILYFTVLWKKHGNEWLKKIEGWTNAN